EAVELRADDDARKTQIRRAARKLFESIRAAERMNVCRTDEAARIVALGLFSFFIDELRALEIDAHSGGARQERCVDAGRVHHLNVRVEIVEQPVRRVARRSGRVVLEDTLVAEIFFEKLPWGEVVLKVDDHRSLRSIWRFVNSNFGFFKA